MANVPNYVHFGELAFVFIYLQSRIWTGDDVYYCYHFSNNNK